MYSMIEFCLQRAFIQTEQMCMSYTVYTAWRGNSASILLSSESKQFWWCHVCQSHTDCNGSFGHQSGKHRLSTDKESMWSLVGSRGLAASAMWDFLFWIWPLEIQWYNKQWKQWHNSIDYKHYVCLFSQVCYFCNVRLSKVPVHLLPSSHSFSEHLHKISLTLVHQPGSRAE